MPAYGPKREEVTLQPVSGKALPVHRGQVLRVTQLEGNQCVDFNAYNLHDYKEYFSTSNTRSYYGFRVKTGDCLWSVHSRNRPMYAMLDMSASCSTDLLAGRCKPAMRYIDGFTPDGYGIHTNCQDTLAASIGEYGLTPDDTHDVLNLWMNSEWDSSGRFWSNSNSARAGDYADLLAMFDTLAVVVTCGNGDMVPASNFYAYHPIRLEVFDRSPESDRLVERYTAKFGGGQRGLADFKVKEVRADRALRREPSYVPEFVNFPIRTRRIAVELQEEQYAALQELKEAGLGETDAEALRAAFFMWYGRNHRPMRVRGHRWV